MWLNLRPGLVTSVSVKWKRKKNKIENRLLGMFPMSQISVKVAEKSNSELGHSRKKKNPVTSWYQKTGLRDLI